MRYVLISGTDIEAFNSNVNRLIQQGWELFGTTQIVVIPQGDGRVTCGQAMFYQALKHMKSANATHDTPHQIPVGFIEA